jgi:hypothetical protein
VIAPTSSGCSESPNSSAQNAPSVAETENCRSVGKSCYSDNNSAMARAVWQEIPYPEVEWGEDQVWAFEIRMQ